MGKKFIIILISFIIFFLVGIFSYNTFYKRNNINDRNILKINVKETSSISKKVLLYGIIDESISSDISIDYIEKEVDKLDFNTGIWISERARAVFLDVLKVSTNNDWIINKDGYLEKISLSDINQNGLINKIIECIDGNDLIIVDYNETYKGVINQEILDFMVERTNFVEKLKYNDNLIINIINPVKLSEDNEGISKKEIYEEMLINIFT